MNNYDNYDQLWHINEREYVFFVNYIFSTHHTVYEYVSRNENEQTIGNIYIEGATQRVRTIIHHSSLPFQQPGATLCMLHPSPMPNQNNLLPCSPQGMVINPLGMSSMSNTQLQ